MWLEVSPELSISSKDIVAIQSVDSLNCIVYTELRQFDVAMPKEVVASLVEARSKNVNPMSNVERLLTELYKGQATPRP